MTFLARKSGAIHITTNVLTKKYNIALASQYKLPNIDDALQSSEAVVSQDFGDDCISVDVDSSSSAYSTQGGNLFSHGHQTVMEMFL